MKKTKKIPIILNVKVPLFTCLLNNTVALLSFFAVFIGKKLCSSDVKKCLEEFELLFTLHSNKTRWATFVLSKQEFFLNEKCTIVWNGDMTIDE